MKMIDYTGTNIKSLALQYVGTKADFYKYQKNQFYDGQLIYCIDTYETYCYNNNTWFLIDKYNDSNVEIENKETKPLICKCCGGQMDNKYYCPYCDTHYI